MNQSLEDTILEGKKYKPNLLQQHLFHIFEIQVRSTLFYISVLMIIEVQRTPTFLNYCHY
jgi:hypothetical protein